MKRPASFHERAATVADPRQQQATSVQVCSRRIGMASFRSRIHASRRQMGWLPRRLWRYASPLLVILAALQIGTARADDDTRFSEEWSALAAAAKSEGRLVASVGMVQDYQRVLDAFGKKFGITVQALGGSGSARVSRILAERSAGKYTVDVAMLSAASTTRRLEPATALAEIPALMMHPEVTDTSRWYLNRHWYMDSADTKTIFAFNVRASSTWVFWYNTEKLTEADIASLKTPMDFLDPKWRGMMADQSWGDPGRLGDMQEAYLASDAGPTWVKRYLTEMNVAFTSDMRLEETWLVKGRNPLKWNEGNIGNILRDLHAKGLPIKDVRLPRETGVLEARGSCCITVLRNAPHPNAAKLFLNWFLSREGQTELHNIDPPRSFTSLREDVAPGNTSEDVRRVPGMTYVFRDFDPRYREEEQSIRDFILNAYREAQGNSRK
jgi:ABC-type Fe3+ transport system substrate-binding protein